MSDLISRSSLVNKIRGIVPGSQDVDFIVGLIENQPTAFDTEKVVEQLVCNSRFVDDINEHNIKCISCVIGQKTAIDIVKKGGVE